MIEKCFKELLEERGQYDDWYKGGHCSGYSCPNYATCKGRIEFDNLPKRAPTTHEIDEAVSRERLYGRSLYEN